MIKDKKTKTMARGHYKLEGKSSIHLTAHAHCLWMCNIKRKEKSGRSPIYNIIRICLNGFLSRDWNKKWRQEWRGCGGICRGGWSWTRRLPRRRWWHVCPKAHASSGHGFHLHPMLTAKLMAHGECEMQVPLRRPIVWPKTKASGDGGDGGSLGVGERQRGGGGDK